LFAGDQPNENPLGYGNALVRSGESKDFSFDGLPVKGGAQ